MSQTVAISYLLHKIKNIGHRSFEQEQMERKTSQVKSKLHKSIWTFLITLMNNSKVNLLL